MATNFLLYLYLFLRQVDKFDNLLFKSQNNAMSDANTQTRKRWIVNISKKELSEAERSVLSKGLNFAITPEKVPVKDFVVATEKVCGKLNQNDAEC